MNNYVSDLHEYFNELDEDLITKAINLAKQNKENISINYLKLKLQIGTNKANLLLELLKENELI